jgi:phosphatidylglycerophosphatase A
LLVALPFPLHLAAILVLLAGGTWSAGKVAELVGEDDPQFVVIDEVVGMLLGLLFMRGQGWIVQLLTLALFRALDIFKPWPIDWAETWRPPGVGIMADDALAGIVAGIVVYFGWAAISSSI